MRVGAYITNASGGTARPTPDRERFFERAAAGGLLLPTQEGPHA